MRAVELKNLVDVLCNPHCCSLDWCFPKIPILAGYMSFTLEDEQHEMVNDGFPILRIDDEDEEDYNDEENEKEDFIKSN